jgi:hypothetical protein
MPAAGVVQAADVAVFPVVGTNRREGESAAISQLIASAYTMQSRALERRHELFSLWAGSFVPRIIR